VEKTEPKRRIPENKELHPRDLAAGRYGTYEMAEIWGAEPTFEYSLRAQGQASLTLSRLHPDIVPVDHAFAIDSVADLTRINADRIRELEDEIGHDVIAINNAIEEKVSPEIAADVNKARTSADTTQTARALQIKASFEVMADSIENLRDIVIEKSLDWIDVPYMDTTHLIDALPTVAGRPFAHYAEMLQSNLKFLRFAYDNSLVGKWGDATGNHHSANDFGIDGMRLQKEYCGDLGIDYMIAPAQVPGLEFEADVFYVLARTGETLNNLAKFMAHGKGNDVGVFLDVNPKRRKGSSGMPHKRGNPTAEEQAMSFRNYAMGNMTTALANCELPYARNLSGSANSRINFEDGFKFADHCVRRMASAVYWLGIDKEASRDRVLRTYGIVTSPRIMNYLTDHRRKSGPMSRSEAHDLVGKLATEAWEESVQFLDKLRSDGRIVSRIDDSTLRELTDVVEYIGESKKIIRTVAGLYHGKETLS